MQWMYVDVEELRRDRHAGHDKRVPDCALGGARRAHHPAQVRQGPHQVQGTLLLLYTESVLCCEL